MRHLHEYRVQVECYTRLRLDCDLRAANALDSCITYAVDRRCVSALIDPLDFFMQLRDVHESLAEIFKPGGFIRRIKLVNTGGGSNAHAGT